MDEDETGQDEKHAHAEEADVEKAAKKMFTRDGASSEMKDDDRQRGKEAEPVQRYEIARGPHLPRPASAPDSPPGDAHATSCENPRVCCTTRR